MDKLNVISLFDGMACGLVALKRCGFIVNEYMASEIDKYAMKVAMKNHPEINQIGDVTKVHYAEGILFTETGMYDIGKIDMVIGGSPCQGFSFSGKGLNFEDQRSKLFFDYVRILNEVKHYNPDVKFLLENVRMKKEHQKVISEFLGVEQVAINSSLLSAQNRYRLYWCNWEITQPEDRHIFLKDILETDVIPVIKNRGIFIEKTDKSQCLDANYWKGVDNHGQRTVCAAMRGRYIVDGHRQDGKMTVAGLTTQRFEVRDDGKTNTLTTVTKDNLIIHNHDGRKFIDVDEVKGCILIGKAELNGHDYIKRVYSENGKAPTLTAAQGGNQEPKVCINEENNEEKLLWRKLTPVECERLQTLEDNYTAGVSNSQRYKMIGNGWTVEVISHILNCLKKDIYK
ncbi:MAG: DNA cytosine methyltransferase [Melioribacteraceae bacterium]|nr:DNA cytosine methyltransferase [Melioribacteraceae bacterium]